MNRIAFNTGRPYTEKGQRIAAKVIDDGVYMVDVDRGIAGFLPGVRCTQVAIMKAYDSGIPRMEYVPPSMDTNKPETPGTSSEKILRQRALRDELETLAKSPGTLEDDSIISARDARIICEMARICEKKKLSADATGHIMAQIEQQHPVLAESEVFDELPWSAWRRAYAEEAAR